MTHVDCESQSALIENLFYVTPVLVMIRLILISDSLRNEFPFDVACVRLFICVPMHVYVGARGLNMYAYVRARVCMHRRYRFITAFNLSVSTLSDTASNNLPVRRFVVNRNVVVDNDNRA